VRLEIPKYTAGAFNLSEFEEIFGLDFSCSLGMVQRCVLLGDVERIKFAVRKALEKYSPVEVINESLIGAMRVIAKLWDEGVYFLPETLMATEAVQQALKICEERMGCPHEKKGVVITHTAEGDIHDLGQQLVNALLRASGYEVIDLGKNVPVNRVVEAVNKYRPLLLTGTALMTTTAPAFKQIANRLKLTGIDLPFICGGGAVTEKYAHSFEMGVYGDNVFQAPPMADEAREGKTWQQIRVKFNKTV
jgi:methanol corrinoid protein